MKKIITLILLLAPCSLLLTSCTAGDKAMEIFDTVFTEASEGYENIKDEVTEKTTAAQEKIDKITQAAEDIGDAADAIGTAIDSIQEINGDEEETEEEPETEPETTEEDATK